MAVTRSSRIWAGDSIANGAITVDETSDEALLVRQDGDVADVLTVNNTDHSGGGLQRTIEIRPNGANDIDPTANVRSLDLQTRLGGAGTNANGTRGTNFVLVGRNGMLSSGTGGSGLRAQSAGFNWASTGTCAEGNGMNTTALVGGGNTIDAGTVTDLIGNRIHVGFQSSAGAGDRSTPNTGTITNAIGFNVLSPADVSDGAGSHTIVNCYGLQIQDQSVTDVTNSYAIDIEDQSDGYAIRTGTGLVEFGGRINQSQGTNAASTNDMTLAEDGNYFVVTGNTQINTIDETDWTSGSIIVLHFASNPVVKHNTAGAGASLALSGSADFNSTSGDMLVLMYDNVVWREISRTII